MNPPQYVRSKLALDRTSRALSATPNASGEPRPEAGAERTLEGVGSTALFGAGCTKRHRLSILLGGGLMIP